MTNFIKIAKTDFSVLESIKNRWSPRSFAEKQINKEIISSILEAARWSPSAFNEQPWRFVLGIKNEGDNYSKIFESLVEFNKNWAKNAPVLIVSCGKTNFTHNNKSNNYVAYDTGQSVAYLTMQALSENIYVHQMAGFDKVMLKNNLNISEGLEVFAVMALGYLDSPEKLSEDLKKLELTERQRKTQNDLIF